MEKSVQVTTSARLGDEGQWSPVPAAGELGHGEQAARGGGTRTRSATLCTHLQAREGPGQREGVEKGAGATWEVLYRGDGEKKAQGQCPQTMHTKRSLCSTEQRVRQDARAPGTTALRSCGGGPGCHSQPPLLGGLGRHPPVTVTAGEKHKVGATKSWRIDLTRVDAFRNNFLESGLFSQVGSRGPAPPAPRPLMHTQSRRAGPRGPRVREGRDLLRVREGLAPQPEAPQQHARLAA